MAWNQSDLDKLEKAIATGARVVEYSTGKIEYRSLTEMYSIRRKIRKALGLSTGTKRVVMKATKGLD